MPTRELPKSRVSIYVCYHKEASLLMSEILKPIQVGSSCAPKQIRGILKDSWGENISDKNPNYCELTALYWAYKNDLCSDFIGLFHYRRHLDFSLTGDFSLDRYGNEVFSQVSTTYRLKCGLYDEQIYKVVSDYDLVTTLPWDVKNVGSKTNWDHYASSNPKLHIEDYERALAIVREYFPEYDQDINEYNNSDKGYYTNIFVMSRCLFLDYCNFLFKVLFLLESELPISNYDKQESRVFGYISEWLLGVYITHLKRLGKHKIKELPRTFINEQKLPLFTKEMVLCSATDENYVLPLCVAITSICLNNPSFSINYFVIVENLPESGRSKLYDLEKKFKNLHLFCIEYNLPDDLVNCLKETIAHSHLTLTAYARLFIGELLPNFIDRVIYLDCDIVCQKRLDDLWATDLDGKCLGGVIDILVKENTNRLHLQRYVNSGVLVIDLKQWREKMYSKKITEYLNAYYKNVLFHDQDAINVVLQNEIVYVDKKWNAQTSSYQLSWLDGWNSLAKTANVIHFVSDLKPWIKGNGNPCEAVFQKYYSNYIGQSRSFYVNNMATIVVQVRRVFREIVDKVFPFGSKRRNTVKKLYRWIRG